MEKKIIQKHYFFIALIQFGLMLLHDICRPFLYYTVPVSFNSIRCEHIYNHSSRQNFIAKIIQNCQHPNYLGQLSDKTE